MLNVVEGDTVVDTAVVESAAVVDAAVVDAAVVEDGIFALSFSSVFINSRSEEYPGYFVSLQAVRYPFISLTLSWSLTCPRILFEWSLHLPLDRRLQV